MLSTNSDVSMVHRYMMASLQGHTCWDDTATAFQTSRLPTTIFTYGFAQIIPLHTVGLLSPGTLQTQVWRINPFFHSLITHLLQNYTFKHSLHICIRLTIHCRYLSCPFVHSCVLSFVCVCMCACMRAYL